MFPLPLLFLSFFLSFWELKSEPNGVILGFPTDQTVLQAERSSLPVECSCFEWKVPADVIETKEHVTGMSLLLDDLMGSSGQVPFSRE